MKITLDLSKLVEEGKLSPAEAQRLTALASHETGSLGINVLLGFGVVAVAAGAVALVPTPLTAMLIGLALTCAGLLVGFNRIKAWAVLAQICLAVGALLFCGGIVAYGDGSLASMLITTAAPCAGAALARPGPVAAPA